MTDSVEHEPERVGLIEDSPLGQDKFAGQGHSAVASAISQLVVTEKGGRVIGLEGEWGSGKSTVVQLTRQKLEALSSIDGSGNDDTRMCIFDAWAHQGDPLRRTFLETMIDELVKWGWLPEEYGNETKSEFSGQKVSAVTTAKPRLTVEGRIATFAALLVPLGIAILDTTFKTLRHFILLGVILALAPIIAVGLILAFMKIRSIYKSDDRVSMRFFQEERETETITNSIVRGEPTSVEFQKYFIRILEAALKEHRKLLLVLDNLDRVNADDARAILATMQTFTSSTLNSVGNASRDHVWTLIPYDQGGLDRLWISSDVDPASSPDPVGNDSALSAAFLEKLFEITFSTPQLVLSEWRDYLLELLSEALLDRTQVELRRVVLLRAAYPQTTLGGIVENEQPTPRQLKKFVNSIGSILRQREDRLPLPDVAFYCLLKQDRIDLRSRLVNGGFPDKRLAPLVSDQVSQNLAALLFGTSVALGAQLLLSRPIEQAILASDPARVEALSTQPGFIAAIESLDLTSWSDSGAVELTRLVSTFKSAGILESPDLLNWIYDRLIPQALLPTTFWSLTTPETGRGLATICSFMDEESRTDSLQRIDPVKPDTANKSFVEMGALSALCGTLVDDGIPIDQLRVELDVPVDLMIEALAAYRSQTNNPDAWSVVNLKFTPDEVSTSIFEVAQSDKPQQALRALEVLDTRRERFSEDALLESCATLLRGSDARGEEELEAILSIVDVLRSPTNSAQLDTLSTDGTLLHHFSQALTNGWTSAAAIVSMLFLARQSLSFTPSPSREAVQGMTSLRKLASDPASQGNVVEAQNEWLSRHPAISLDLLCRQIDSDSLAAPWVHIQLVQLFGKSRLEVSPTQLLNNFEVLQGALSPDQFHSLLAQVLSPDGHLRTITDNSSDPQLALAILQASISQLALTEHQPEIRAWASSIVHETSEAIWSQELSSPSGGPVVQLCLTLAKLGFNPSATGDLDEALRLHVERIKSGEPAWLPKGEEYLNLTTTLSSATQVALARSIVSGLDSREDEIPRTFFITLGPFLSEHEESRTHEQLPYIVARWVANSQWDGVSWFVNLTKSHDDVLRETDRSVAFEYLREKVIDREAEFLKDEAPPQLVSLGSVLGISPEFKSDVVAETDPEED